MKLKIVTYLVIAFSTLCFSCKKQKPEPKSNTITFKVEVPKDTPKNASVYVSGNFEGWSGGSADYKLEKIEDFYYLNLQPKEKSIQYKFTLGSWASVEHDANGNDIENRTYDFNTKTDTITLTIAAWADGTAKPKSTSTATKNVQIFDEAMQMPQLNRKRKIWVYTPPNYYNSNKSYPVLYMHDGQNLFDKSTAYSGEWEVDETLNRLQKENGLELIVVAIDNGGDFRMEEYSPWQNRYAKPPKGEAYVNFIVNTLKPKIDSAFRTKPNAENTAIMGSSMGGLISHYAALKHPSIFGKVGVFSPSFWINDEVYNFTKTHSNLKENRFYFLLGSNEGNDLKDYMNKVTNIMRNNGFQSSNLASHIVEGGEHKEWFWQAEFPEAISWLFEKPKPKKRTFANYIVAQPVANAELASGKLLRIEDFPTKYITQRPVDVWLPENYSDTKKYAVLYMHDGQMLFDASTTWNKQEWKVDEWVSTLMQQGKIKDVIVVAIHNISDIRWQDLFPQKAIHNIDKAILNKLKDISGNKNFNLNGNNYLKFIVEDLKPYIDQNFSTLKTRENTFVMGSSMGGLMSVYAVAEYPEVFGGAACLSTHWVGAMPTENNPFTEAIFKYMQANLPQAGTHKLYFDYGNKTLDAHYPKYAPKVDAILQAKGYNNTNAKNLFFEGTDHSENSWNKRLDVPLTFLLNKN